jgi:hypothetical protein
LNIKGLALTKGCYSPVVIARLSPNLTAWILANLLVAFSPIIYTLVREVIPLLIMITSSKLIA